MNELEIKYLGNLQRLGAKPGDRFVLQVDANITAETADKLQQFWLTWSDSQYGKLLILGKGMQLGVVGPETEDNG